VIDSIASILRSIVLLLALLLVVFVGWKGYQTYKAIEAKFAKIEKYFAKLEGVIGEHDGAIHRISDTIRKWKISDRMIVPSSEIEADQTPIPIDNTYIEPVREKPTVILYSINGCGPCEQWWRDQAPLWIRAGWDVKRETSTINRPTPYWKVWDGSKWMEFDRTLTIEKYKSAGGK
jgi:hypothetical protein